MRNTDANGEARMGVVQLPSRAGEPSKRDLRLKRLALQLAVQLPEDAGEAMDVLEMTKALVQLPPGDLRPV